MKLVKFENIKTNRLLLRNLKLSDTEEYYKKIGGNEAVSKFMLWDTHKNVEETKELVSSWVKMYDEPQFYKWAITLKETDELIGIIQLLRFDEKENSCEVSYMISDSYWNKGYTTEALKAVLNFGFKKIKLDSVIADHYSENIASGKVMLKAGMKYTGRVPDRFENAKGYKELDCYKISKEDWNIIRSKEKPSHDVYEK